MQLFYQPEIEETTHHFTFDKEESRHIIRVLRKKQGDTVYITNGKGFLFTAVILSDNEKGCVVEITDKSIRGTKNYYLHMAVAPTKMNDRYEWFLEKATEIGIDEITPIICEHSERTVLKTDRMEKIIQSAMKQSLQTYLPRLNQPVKFSDFLDKSFEGQLFIAHCEDSDKSSLRRKVLADHKVTILIGPEGDFSHQEIKNAITKGFIPISLGDQRLRTETAALVACHTVALTNQ